MVSSLFEGVDIRAIGIILAALLLFVFVAVKIKRPIVYNGKQERPKKKPLNIFTLLFGGGTSFATENTVLRPKELSSRRKKFGESVVSPILWSIGIAIAVFFASLFF